MSFFPVYRIMQKSLTNTELIFLCNVCCFRKRNRSVCEQKRDSFSLGARVGCASPLAAACPKALPAPESLTLTASSNPRYRNCWYHCCTSGWLLSHSCRFWRLRLLRNSLAAVSFTDTSGFVATGAEMNSPPTKGTPGNF